MRLVIPVFAALALFLVSTQAEAKSCSSFVIIKSFDAGASTVTVSHEKGKISKFFPRPEGSPSDTTKVPNDCKRKITKEDTFAVKATGGRLTITQVRSNFEGKMLNKPDDESWLASRLKQLIASETTLVAVIRPGMKKSDPLGITTLYLPITDEELAEIKRLEAQAEDA